MENWCYLHHQACSLPLEARSRELSHAPRSFVGLPRHASVCRGLTNIEGGMRARDESDTRKQDHCAVICDMPADTIHHHVVRAGAEANAVTRTYKGTAHE